MLSKIVNEKKSVAMIFNGSSHRSLIIGDRPIEYVESCTYLGHIFDTTLSPAKDIERSRKAFLRSANVIAYRFAHCSIAVKMKLLQAYCMHCYGCELWSGAPKYLLDSIARAINLMIKRICGVSKYASNSLTCRDVGCLTADRNVAMKTLLLYKDLLSTDIVMLLTVRDLPMSFSKRVESMIAQFGLQRMCFMASSPEDVKHTLWCDQLRRAESREPQP